MIIPNTSVKVSRRTFIDASVEEIHVSERELMTSGKSEKT
jgi:hypothetical protein